ncbi:MAG TPA: ATP-binding cassette domain-containing protein [Acidimicrobiales bacterium]|nr:ATP-binding cassette domain-containing protein [Acidimicrobiales bacterium]
MPGPGAPRRAPTTGRPSAGPEAAGRRPGGGGRALPALGALLVAYLALPMAAFAGRLATSSTRGFAAAGLLGAARTSVESATITTALVALTGVPLAHWLASGRGRVRSAVGAVVQLPLALPPVMGGVVLLYLVGPYTALGRLSGQRLTGTLAAIVCAQAFVAAPFTVVAARAAFAAVDPALDDLAATLGLGRWRRFAGVAVPAAAEGVRAGLVLCWLRAFGEYGATVLLAYHPYSLPVFTSVQFGSGGLPDTQAPTALAVAAAAVAVVVSRVRPPRRRARRLPEPVAPVPAVDPVGARAAVSFAVDVAVGGFRLRADHAATGHRLAVIGPSGSGKTLTLRAVAGLLGPAAATVSVGGRAVGTLPPERRGIGLVPQGHLLLPGRTVWQQLLAAPGTDPGVASWWLHTLHLEGLAGRRPHELSGGQRQRVALAQALARQPAVVLLDEPTSALDSAIRDDLRAELRRLQREVGVSTVVVTHDPEEAALLADELVVLGAGEVLQAGPRHHVLAHPASAEVARLLGVRNVADGVVDRPGRVMAGALVVEADTGHAAPGSAVSWCARADQLHCTAGPACATVVEVLATGAAELAEVLVDGGPLLRVQLVGPDRAPTAPGARVGVRVDAGVATVWPA